MASTSRVPPFSDDNALVDDFYFSALFDDDEIFPISDEKYAYELHFQEALVSATVSLSRKNKQSSNYQDEEDEEYDIPNKRQNRETETESDTLDLSAVLCMICMEPKPYREIFKNKTCTCDNSYCSECISKHIGIKIQENILRVNCPGFKCKGVLEPEFCQHIVPKKVFERWEEALCESLILGSQRFYCPFKDCSAILIDDGGYAVTQSECPNCRRLFCAQCKVTWHSGLECSEFQSLSKDERGTEDLMAMELAKKNKWRRCPRCQFYVEKTEGCLHISCRCGYHFCYGCGGNWRSNAHACA